jgi:CubicO group peptidase (beta-lactamase class C family)
MSLVSRALLIGFLILMAACSRASNQKPKTQTSPMTEQPSIAKSVAEVLAPIRQRTGVPALAGAIVTSDGVQASGVAGVRKLGTDVAATIEDDWHLGSDTKAMTATLIGLLIDDGKLKFESTIAEVFPEFAPKLPAAFQKVTVAHLLAHRSGLPHDAQWRAIDGHGSLTDQRLAAVKGVAEVEGSAAPGEKYAYSNWGYVILGAMAERVGGKPWEELMQQRVFGPLHMQHVGFGGTGTPGKVDQPWPHVGGKPRPRNGPAIDNPPVMAPAGGAHCPIGEWAKFIANELRGLRGEPNLLSPATFKRLHTPEFGGNYAGGWGLRNRDGVKGPTYNHAGSNTMNFAVATLAPNRNVAFLVCTNEGDGEKPCGDTVGALQKFYADMSK